MIINMHLAFAAQWCVIIPFKGGIQAKSRLGSLPDENALADRFATKTLSAVIARPAAGSVPCLNICARQRWHGHDVAHGSSHDRIERTSLDPLCCRHLGGSTFDLRY
jgi:hypothetical protein